MMSDTESAANMTLEAGTSNPQVCIKLVLIVNNASSSSSTLVVISCKLAN